MNRYKGRIFHHGRPRKFSKAVVLRAVHDYLHRRATGDTDADVARRYRMSRQLLYHKVKLVRFSRSSGRLSRREGLYLLDRYSLSLIHNGGRLFTGLRTSLIDTEIILHNGEIPRNVLPSDVDILLRLKRGLRYIKNHRGPLTLKVFQHINAIVAHDSLEPGHFALHPMTITGVAWQSPRPNPKRARAIIERYKNNLDSPRITAIKIMLEFDRYQFFWNGNKRTAWLAANYYLLQHGAGILNISQHQENRWDHLLAEFYETGQLRRITAWVNRNCIFDKV